VNSLSGTLHFKHDEVVLSLPTAKQDQTDANPADHLENPQLIDRGQTDLACVLNGNSTRELRSEAPLPGVVNYFIGK
jgi:hypothetical protein